VVATGGPRATAWVRYAAALARRRHRVALTSYGHDSKFTRNVNSKLLTPYVILSW
jgi:hypothetical protein